MASMRLVGRVALGLALMFGQAEAQRLGNPASMVPNFNASTLMSVMQEFGAQTEMLSLGGYPTVGVIMPSGARFLMTPTACPPAENRCRGVSIQALFSSQGASAASVNRFNQQGTIPKAVLLGEQVVVFHYVIADYGIPRGNFDSHIAVLEVAIQRYASFGNGGGMGQSVSLGAETHHVGTRPMSEPQHPNGFITLMNPPAGYVND